MTRPLRAILIGAFAVASALGGVLFYRWQAGLQPLDPVATGQIMLAANFHGLDGKEQSLAQWRGKVLVVNFWATWCAPCREEIPGFIKFQEAHRARGVQFVGIAVDQKERVGPYARDIGINYPVLIGGVESIDLARKVGNSRGVLPFTLILDRDAKAVASEIGVLKPEKLETVLKPLM